MVIHLYYIFLLDEYYKYSNNNFCLDKNKGDNNHRGYAKINKSESTANNRSTSRI